MKWAKLGFVGLLFVAIVPYYLPRLFYFVPIVDGANWGIHEAGHFLFRPFGAFIESLGGTVGQLLAPFAVTAAFIYRRRKFEMGIGGWWLAENLMNVGQYVADARFQNLPVTGDHDWTYLLGRMGLLEWDRVLGGTMKAVALLLALAALGWSAWHAWKASPEPEAE